MGTDSNQLNVVRKRKRGLVAIGLVVDANARLHVRRGEEAG